VRGIPTEYAGVRFRSRLEARWAAFFDLVGWPWQYEPLDLSGYIPDFVLPLGRGGDQRPLLVEVKPALYIAELAPHVDKVMRSGWRGEALVVGGAVFEQYESGHDVLGVIAHCQALTIHIARVFDCPICERLSFAAKSNLVLDEDDCITQTGHGEREPCRLCGDTGVVSAGGHVVGADESDRVRSCLIAWAKAGNTVQWKGGASV